MAGRDRYVAAADVHVARPAGCTAGRRRPRPALAVCVVVAGAMVGSCSSNRSGSYPCSAAAGTYALDLTTDWPLPLAQEQAEDGPGCDTVPGPSSCEPTSRSVAVTVRLDGAIVGGTQATGSISFADGGSCQAQLDNGGYETDDDAGNVVMAASCDVISTGCTGTAVSRIGLRVHTSGPGAGTTAVNMTAGACCWSGAIVPGQQGGTGDAGFASEGAAGDD
jgi:hypothetical protein